MAVKLRKVNDESLSEVQVGGGEDDQRLPWNPIIRFARPFSRSYSSGDWELSLRLLTRGTLPPGFAQEYAVIIEVIDTTGRAPVVNDVLAERPGVYTALPLRAAA
jgi:hypothetical protein